MKPVELKEFDLANAMNQITTLLSSTNLHERHPIPQISLDFLDSPPQENLIAITAWFKRLVIALNQVLAEFYILCSTAEDPIAKLRAIHNDLIQAMKQTIEDAFQENLTSQPIPAETSADNEEEEI